MINTVPISQLKVNPASVLACADDYPVAISRKGKVEAFIIGRDLYEKIFAFMEDQMDAKAVEETDFDKGKDFEKIAGELGV